MSAMLTPAEAEEQIAHHLPCLPIESLPVGQCAGGVLRENVYAERDHPPFDRVAMDGIALDCAGAAGQRVLRIQATQAAGDPPLTLATATHCIEVMTGAMLPAGCDAVVPVERIRVAEGSAQLLEDVAVSPGMNVHARASDLRQGTLLLSAGTRLEAPDVATAAGAGMARLRVSQQPAFMVISTGNELVEPGDPIESWQLRRSNAYGLVAALRRRGFLRVADDHLPDDAGVLMARLREHLRSYEVLILSGGVSMGKFDLVPMALEACGVKQVFHKVAQRPGKPFWFGMAPGGNAVFALPGNPVSTLVCLARYVIPAIDRAMGVRDPQAGEKIALAGPVNHGPSLAGFLPVTTETDDWGRPWARTVSHNGSGDFAALAGTHGFVELPPGPNTYPKGFVTRLYRW
ncbi:MAG TPA: molybdopterin molybdotransferase MoeA [Steroidobacteraceae bacterium]|nr:molybdopterin molybdotransferase MoeA [Steroidobacteraceae bacterium]